MYGLTDVLFYRDPTAFFTTDVGNFVVPIFGSIENGSRLKNLLPSIFHDPAPPISPPLLPRLFPRLFSPLPPPLPLHRPVILHRTS